MKQLRVASYNVHKCVGTDGVFDPARIVAVLAEIDADIVALQEADHRFGEREGLLDLDLLYKETGLSHAPLPPALRTKRKSHGWRDNVILYRSGAVRDMRHIDLPGFEPRGALVVDIHTKQRTVSVIGAHLGLLKHSREEQARALLMLAIPSESDAVVLMGDMNEWRSPAHSSLKALDLVLGQHPSPHSFPATHPRFSLDRIFTVPVDILSPIEVHDTPLAQRASDHLPITARISLS